ncbi:MAG: 4-hydroxy-3-methylbut-2-enyl diphosphate reductase [Treponema sp.]|jgi:4-hydroxy-3-methylbut-2-enyl diphosphate reductase|nr:4-hydroxy-3-methylbut-2-enyl diphosphate reductase [Treponema sp.]
MRVRRAETLGFCMGVRRAMEMADAALSQAALSRPSRSGAVYAMGTLIHNSQAMEPLLKRGLAVLTEEKIPENLSGIPVVIRAHGISPRLENTLAGRGARLLDATCPKVKASQLKAQELCSLGRRVFLAGEGRHAEIIGILGYAPDCVVVGSAGEAAAAAEKLRGEAGGAALQTALIGQTTWDMAEYAAIAEAIRSYFPDLEVCATICGATRARQDSLRALCGEVDAIIVAGGRESANTRRLLDIARSFPGPGGRGKPAWLVETPAEIPGEVDRYETLGICAGASTPDALIGAIEEALLQRPAKP